jgi:hypothetical protein
MARARVISKVNLKKKGQPLRRNSLQIQTQYGIRDHPRSSDVRANDEKEVACPFAGHHESV